MILSPQLAGQLEISEHWPRPTSNLWCGSPVNAMLWRTPCFVECSKSSMEHLQQTSQQHCRMLKVWSLFQVVEGVSASLLSAQESFHIFENQHTPQGQQQSPLTNYSKLGARGPGSLGHMSVTRKISFTRELLASFMPSCFPAADMPWVIIQIQHPSLKFQDVWTWQA